MKKFLLNFLAKIFVVTLLGFVPVGCQSADHQSLVDEVVERSGIANVLLTIPDYFSFPGAEADKGNQIVLEALRNAYDAKRSKEIFEKYLIQNADRALLERMIAWMDTPLGKRIEAEEKASTTAEGGVEYLDFIEKFKKEPTEDTRRKAIYDLISASGSEKFQNDLFSLTVKRILILHRKASRQEGKITDKMIDDYVGKLRKQNEGLIKGRVYLSQLFTYRNLSFPELQQYIDKQNSVDGRQFNRLLSDGVKHVFEQTYELAERIIDQKLREQKNLLSDSVDDGHDKAPEAGISEAERLKRQGDIFIKSNRIDDAISSYRKSIGLDPSKVGTYFLLADCYRKKDYRYEEIKILRKALALEPEDAQIHKNLGEAYLAVGSLEAAAQQSDILQQMDGREATRVQKEISIKREERKKTEAQSTTRWDFYSAHYSWFTKKLVNPYSHKIKGYPTNQQEKVLKFLDGFAHYVTKHPPVIPREDLITQGKALVASGDQPPIVYFGYGLLLHDQGGEYLDESIGALRTALDGFYQNEEYSGVFSFMASNALAEMLFDQGKKESGGFSFWRNYGLRCFHRSLLAGDFSQQEQNLALHYLLKMPEQLFRPQDDKFQVIAEHMEDLPAVNRWLQLAVQGLSETEIAWQARGSGYARTVTEEGWARFHEHMHKANDLLEQAWRLRPEYPATPSFLMTVARVNHGEVNHTPRFWLNQAIKSQFDYRDAYYGYLNNLTPRWGGSHEAMYQFGEECLLSGRYDSYTPFIYFEVLSRIAEELPYSTYSLPFRNADVQRKLEGLFDNMLQDKHVDSRERQRIRLMQAVAKALAGHYEEARQIVAAIKPVGELRKPFAGTYFSWKYQDFSSFEAELRVFTGKAKEIVLEAERLELQEKLEKALSKYRVALSEIEPTDSDAKRYLVERMAWMQLGVTVEKATYQKGFTPLHYASQEGRTDIVRFLLDNGYPVDPATEEGETPLHMAVYRHREVVRLLLSKGADINAKEHLMHFTPLIKTVAYANDPELALELIKRGADVNAEGDGGWTALHFAVLHGYDDVCLALLEKGANPYAQLETGKTVFDFIRIKPNSKLKGILLRFGSERIPKEKITKLQKMSRNQLQVLHEKNPTDVKVTFNLAVKCKVGKKYQEAIGLFRKVLSQGLSQYTDRCFYFIGLCYVELGEYEKAIENFQKDLEFNPRSSANYRNQARAYRLAGKSELGAKAERIAASLK